MPDRRFRQELEVSGAGVVGGDRQDQVVLDALLIQQVADIVLAERHVGFRLVQVRLAAHVGGQLVGDIGRGGRHELHQAASAGAAAGGRVEPAFLTHQGEQQRPVHREAAIRLPRGERVERRVVGSAVGRGQDAAEPHGERRHAAGVGQGYDGLLQRVVAARVDAAKLQLGGVAAAGLEEGYGAAAGRDFRQ